MASPAPTRAEFRTHLAVLAALLVLSAVAALHPTWLLHNPLPCATRAIFHVNCPFCGMTHDFVSIWHHQKPTQNPGSWLAFLGIYFCYPTLVFWAWLRRRPDVFYHPILRRAALAALVLLWIANNQTR